MSKYLITGITGFAGPHLANLLYDIGHEIYGLTRRCNGMETDILDTVSPECFNSIKFIYADITDSITINKIFKDYGFDGVFHLAAQSHPPTSFIDPVGTFRTNVMGSANIIEAIRLYQPDCKLMFCSTSEVYGNNGKDGHKIKEDDNILPANPYGVSKAAIDFYMQERMKNKKIKGFITRAFSHTGIRRGKNFSISSDAYQVANIIKNTSNSLLPVLCIEVGNLGTTRVVIDVRDVVNAYYLLMQNEESCGNIYNICGNIPRKMNFFTDYLIQLSGLDISKIISEKYFRPIDIHYQHGNCEAIERLTGWKPQIAIENTLRDLLNYWLKK